MYVKYSSRLDLLTTPAEGAVEPNAFVAVFGTLAAEADQPASISSRALIDVNSEKISVRQTPTWWRFKGFVWASTKPNKWKKLTRLTWFQLKLVLFDHRRICCCVCDSPTTGVRKTTPCCRCQRARASNCCWTLACTVPRSPDSGTPVRHRRQSRSWNIRGTCTALAVRMRTMGHRHCRIDKFTVVKCANRYVGTSDEFRSHAMVIWARTGKFSNKIHGAC